MAGHSLLDALAAWRADRTNVALANRVDDASARVARVAAPNKLHGWWVAQAQAYDPVVVATLLETLYVQARDHHVTWAGILARETPLVEALRAHHLGEPDAVRDRAWLNLVDRIGLMLTWPDDPRVALALATAVFERPLLIDRGGMTSKPPHAAANAVIAAVAKRVIEIGDLRAIQFVSLAKQPSSSSQRLRDAIARAPEPRTGVTPDVDAAWQAVLAEPHALAPRLVLADAYLDRGDPRGEMIALSCAPLAAIEKARAAGEELDAAALFGAGADRIAQLCREHWYRWFGELALVVARAPKFHGGLLSDIHVGHATPRWAWERVADHRELCAVHRLCATRETDRDAYADFILALARKPRTVYLDSAQLAALRARARSVDLPGVSLNLHGAVGTLAAFAESVLALSPKLERLGLHVREDHLPEATALARRLPGLQFYLEGPWVLAADHGALLDGLPNVRVL